MAALKMLYFLMAIVHGGPNEPFTLTRLAAFSDAMSCDKAAQAATAALAGANPDGGSRVEIGCIASDKIDALKRH